MFAQAGRTDPEKPNRIGPEIARQFAALGVTVPQSEIRNEDDVFEIWDINAGAFRIFLDLSTQWRSVALTGLDRVLLRRTGLDYAALAAVLTLRGVKGRSRARLFDEVRVLEAAALEAWGDIA